MKRPGPPHPLLVPAIAASQFAPPFMISGVAVALPAMGAELAAGAVALSLVETLFLAASVALLLPAGRLSDAADKAALYKGGLAAFALCSIAIGLSGSIGAVLALRFVQGAVSAATQTAGPAIIAEVVPPERRGRAFGMSLASIYAGLTLGPICAGLLVDAWGWRAVFLAGGAAVLALALPIHFMLRARWRRPAPGAVHLPGTALVLAATMALVAGAAMLREGAAAYGAMVVGTALLGVFVATQRRAAQPLLNVEVLMRNRVLRNALLVQWLLYCNAFGTVFLLALYIQSVLGHAANTAGQILAVGTVIMALIAPLAGRLADRHRPAALSAAGAAAVLGAALMATRLDAGSPLLYVAAILAVQGVGFGLFSTPNMTIVMNAVPAERIGIASALSAASRAAGMVSGMLIVGALVSLHVGHAAPGAEPARFVAAMQPSFWLLAAASAAALFVSLLRGK